MDISKEPYQEKSCVQLFVTPMDYSPPGFSSLSMGFSRQESWSGLPFPPPGVLLQGIFPTQGSNTGLLPCRQILYHLSHREAPHQGKLENTHDRIKMKRDFIRICCMQLKLPSAAKDNVGS